MKFDDRLSEFTLDVVLDLTIDDGACVRAPILSQIVPLEAEKRIVVVTASNIDINSELRGLGSVFDLQLGIGGWLGPVLLTAQAGVGEALCTPGVCGKESDGSLRSGTAFPFSVDARYSLGTTVVGAFTNAG